MKLNLKLDEKNVAIIILLVGEASGVFAGFCPSWFTVSSPFFHEQEAKDGNVKRIRWGEVAATGIVLGTGYAVSCTTGDHTPFLASILIAGIFVGGYEYMILHPAKSDSVPETTTNAVPAYPWWR